MGQNPQADAGCQPKALLDKTPEPPERQAREQSRGTAGNPFIMTGGHTQTLVHPAERPRSSSRAEPYTGLPGPERHVHSEDVAGEPPGEWKTGTSAWSRRGSLEHLAAWPREQGRTDAESLTQSCSLRVLPAFWTF